MQKIYCYVDETGKEPQSEIFIVSVVVLDKDRDRLLDICEQLEKVSGKRKDKWGKAKHDRRMRYLRLVFADERFKGSLRFSVFRGTREFDFVTLVAIAGAVRFHEPTEKFTTLVYVDGLSKKKRREYGVALRKMGLPVRQVRGIARDESNALIRLADAVAGFVRDSLESDTGEIKALFERALREGTLVEVH